LNHIIILNNCFGKFTVDGLFFIVPEEHWRTLKTILSFLHIMPVNYKQSDIDDDKEVLKRLYSL